MLPKLVDMAKTLEEIQGETTPGGPHPLASVNKYPYGLSISITHEELEKLGLDADCEVGDMIHLFALSKVTSVSKTDTGEGEKCRIELQITHLGLESEDEENKEEDSYRPDPKGYKDMYNEAE